jgi:hypothetical protein
VRVRSIDWYFPIKDLQNRGRFEESQTHTTCGWKGTSRSYDGDITVLTEPVRSRGCELLQLPKGRRYSVNGCRLVCLTLIRDRLLTDTSLPSQVLSHAEEGSREGCGSGRVLRRQERSEVGKSPHFRLIRTYDRPCIRMSQVVSRTSQCASIWGEP